MTVEDLGDEIFNVLAYDGDPSEIELLVVGHLDTVVPSSNWQHEEYTNDGERYYALGACDTRGGIAAALDAIGRVGTTRKVGYLFYGDEEYQFVGMKEFVRMHPEIAPKLGLSVCGGKGEAYLGWRACTEMEFVFEADREKVKPLFETFRPVHGGKVSPTATTGFLDATLIAGKHGTQFMCLSPDGDRQHASDEYTSIAGLVAYRDCMVDLLSGYKVG